MSVLLLLGYRVYLLVIDVELNCYETAKRRVRLPGEGGVSGERCVDTGQAGIGGSMKKGVGFLFTC